MKKLNKDQQWKKNVGILFLTFLFLVFNISNAKTPSAFLKTLPDTVIDKLHHCHDLPERPRAHLCELIGALDSEGSHLPESKQLLKPTNCKYRSDGAHKTIHRYATSPSLAFERILESCRSTHRRCTEADFNNFTEHYNAGETPNCRYVVWSVERNGLGNRILTFVSTFLYAVLTQRVFVFQYTDWNKLFCDSPIAGLQAQVPSSKPLDHSKALRYVSFLANNCNGRGNPRNKELCDRVKVLDTDLQHGARKAELDLLTCPSGLRRTHSVPYVAIRHSNQYFATSFYLNPAFAPLLDILFPERNPFHVLARSLLAPSDVVWERVRGFLDGPLHGATRRVGVQIREFQRGHYTEAFDDSVAVCLRHRLGLSQTWKQLGLNKLHPHTSEFVSVYVASLQKRHARKLKEMLRNQAGREMRVTWQNDDDWIEKHDMAQQQDALVDMWVLSLSDVIVASKKSTFGYVAQGMAGVVSYYMDPTGAEEVCKAGIGLDPCHHRPPLDLICEDDEGVLVHVGGLVNSSRSLRPCVDFQGEGLQLIGAF